jgi:hypothetical protein
VWFYMAHPNGLAGLLRHKPPPSPIDGTPLASGRTSLNGDAGAEAGGVAETSCEMPGGLGEICSTEPGADPSRRNSPLLGQQLSGAASPRFGSAEGSLGAAAVFGEVTPCRLPSLLLGRTIIFSHSSPTPGGARFQVITQPTDWRGRYACHTKGGGVFWGGGWVGAYVAVLWVP